MQYTLSEETAEKLKKLLDSADDGEESNPSGLHHDAHSHVAFIQCGELIDEDNNIFEATVQYITTDDLAWNAEDADVYLCSPDFDSLTPDNFYLAIGYGDYDFEDDVRQLFVCTLGSGGDDDTVAQVIDTAGTNLYFAKVVTLDPVALTWTQVGDNILLFDANAIHLTNAKYYQCVFWGTHTQDDTDYDLYSVTNVESGSGTITVETSDGSTTVVTNVTTIKIADPLTLTNNTGGVVTIGLKTLVITCNGNGTISPSWS